MQRARGPRRPLAFARGGRRGRPDARADRSSRRQLPGHGRRDRPAAERPGVLARDAGSGRRAARADGVPGASPRRIAGGRGRDRRRPDRDRACPADRWPVAARRSAGWPDCGSRPARRATRSRCSRPTRRSPSSACRWCSTSAPGCTGGSRRAASCSAGATPTSSPARHAPIDWAAFERWRERLAGFVPVTRDLGVRRVWCATIDYTPDHLPILGPAVTPDGRPYRRRHDRLGGWARDDVGAGGLARRGRPRPVTGRHR